MRRRKEAVNTNGNKPIRDKAINPLNGSMVVMKHQEDLWTRQDQRPWKDEEITLFSDRILVDLITLRSALSKPYWQSR